MGILDWFKNRPSQFDPDRLSDEMTLRAIDKAVTLTNPSLKLVPAYQERLSLGVTTSVRYIRDLVLSLPPAIKVSSSNWSTDPSLRAFFVSADDIPSTLGRSNSLRTLFDKFPGLDEAYFILVMKYNEQRALGMSLQGDVVQRDVAQTIVGFSEHQVRICGHEDSEILRLLGAQAYEYLVAQALSEIGEERSERRELADNRELIRSRLRLLRQQGPGLGSIFGSAPVNSGELLKLESQLLENEQQMEALGSPQFALEAELETLREVLEQPERYLRGEQKRLRLSTLNAVLDTDSSDVSSDVEFSLARLQGTPQMERAFVMAHFSRSDMPSARMNFDQVARYL